MEKGGGITGEEEGKPCEIKEGIGLRKEAKKHESA